MSHGQLVASRQKFPSFFAMECRRWRHRWSLWYFHVVFFSPFGPIPLLPLFSSLTDRQTPSDWLRLTKEGQLVDQICFDPIRVDSSSSVAGPNPRPVYFYSNERFPVVHRRNGVKKRNIQIRRTRGRTYPFALDVIHPSGQHTKPLCRCRRYWQEIEYFFTIKVKIKFTNVCVCVFNCPHRPNRQRWGRRNGRESRQIVRMVLLCMSVFCMSVSCKHIFLLFKDLLKDSRKCIIFPFLWFFQIVFHVPIDSHALPSYWIRSFGNCGQINVLMRIDFYAKSVFLACVGFIW